MRCTRESALLALFSKVTRELVAHLTTTLADDGKSDCDGLAVAITFLMDDLRKLRLIPVEGIGMLHVAVI